MFVRTDERRLAAELASARAALEHGRLKRAIRNVWSGGRIAARLNDQESLEALIEIGKAIRGRASGRELDAAATLVAYCSHCLDDARAGISRTSPLARLVRIGSSDATKTCPDCAETIRAAARV